MSAWRAGVLVLVVACSGDSARGPAYAVPGDHGDGLTVEVLNGTSRPGLARTGTRVLRRRGIDVVYFGNATRGAEDLDSTRIIVRRGSAAVGERVRRALGAGTVVVEPDSSRLLDASVLLGTDFVPRVEFHP